MAYEHWDGEQEDDYADELTCTWCGGDGWQDNEDPLWHGHDDAIPCRACGGSGLRSRQWLF